MTYREAGEWKGITKYACDECPFEALRERLIIEHVDQAHPRTRAPKVGLLGPTGKPVESIPVTDSPAETHEPLPAASSLGSPYDPPEAVVGDADLIDCGGGWFELPDGRKRHGLDNAVAALAESHASTPDLS